MPGWVARSIGDVTQLAADMPHLAAVIAHLTDDFAHDVAVMTHVGARISGMPHGLARISPKLCQLHGRMGHGSVDIGHVSA